MGIRENWESFVVMSKDKAAGHAALAQYWDRAHNFLSLSMIFLSTATTICTLVPLFNKPDEPYYISSVIGAITTLISALKGQLSADERRQKHNEASTEFRALMLKMVRVETERDYEELWKEYNKEMVVEPFLPDSYRTTADPDFSMAPEFTIVVAAKKAETRDGIKQLKSGKMKPADLEARFAAAESVR